MRLAYVVGTYPAPSETFIAREMEGLRARGHEVDIFSVFRPDTATPGVTYGWQTTGQRLLRKAMPAMAADMLGQSWRELFRSRGCHAVVAHFGSIPSTVAISAAGDLPLIISLHARDIYVEGERLSEKLTRAQAVITCTRANLEYLRAQYPAFAGRIHLIYHGLPQDWLAAPVPERHRAAGDPLHILAVGRFVEKKGFHVLLEACALLRDNGVPFTARIIGDGEMKGALEQQRRKAGLETMVSFPGWLTQEAVREAYAAADVFCCPSVIARDGDRDGLPNVLVEAMSTGLPAVGSDISALPEAIEHEATGLLVPPERPDLLAAALRRCTDSALCVRLGNHAAALVRERFIFEQGLDQLDALLGVVSD